MPFNIIPSVFPIKGEQVKIYEKIAMKIQGKIQDL